MTDSLKTVSNQLSGHEKLTVLIDLSWEFKNSHVDSALQTAKEALSLAKQLNSEKGKAQSYNSIANAFEAMGSFDSAQVYFNQALTLFKNLKDTIGIADAYNNLGIIYDESGKYDISLSYYFEALRMYEQPGDRPAKVAMVLSNIGIVYKKQKEYQKVLEYYARAEAIYNEIGSQFGLMVTKGNIGSVYLNLQKFDSAISYSESAKSLYEQAGYHRYVPYMLHNIGLGYEGLNQLEKAKDQFKESIRLHKFFNNGYETASASKALANNLFQSKKYDEAIQVANDGLNYARQSQASEVIVDLTLLLARLHASMGDNENSVNYYEMYLVGKDSLFETNKTRQIFELQTQYETEKKEQQIVLQLAELERNQLTMQRDRYLRAGLLLTLVLIIIIGFLIRNRMKHKQNLMFEQANAVAREAQIAAVIASQDRERNRFARDLHDTFGQLISVLNLNLDSLRERKPSPEQRDLVFQASSNVLQDMYAELKNVCFDLMPQSLMKGGVQPALEEFALRINVSGKVYIEADFFGFSDRLNELEEISLYRISQEWINNVLKYSDADKITLQLTRDDTEITLLIEDNGSGFDAKKLMLGKGNGWKNIQSRAKLIRAEISLDTKEGRKGNTLIVEFKLEINSALKIAQTVEKLFSPDFKDDTKKQG